MNFEWILIMSEYELWVNFLIMGELLNYGLTFELWVNFWIMGELWNYGWNVLMMGEIRIIVKILIDSTWM